MEPTDSITIVNARPNQECDKGLELQLKEEDFRIRARNNRELIQTIQDELDYREDDLKDGLSFLDLKNDTLLSYMIDVCSIVLRKVRGEAIEDHNSVQRCVEYRIILEKIKTIDQKLAYQLNKLITLPDEAEQDDQKIDVNNLAINLEGVESGEEESGRDSPRHQIHESGNEDYDSGDDLDDEDMSDNGSDDPSEQDSDHVNDKYKRGSPHKVSKNSARPKGVYKPPKLRSVAYTGDNRSKSSSSGRRANHDDFYQDEETGEIIEGGRKTQGEIDRLRYEEDNYTRLPDENPKKLKRKIKTREYKRGFKRIMRRKFTGRR